MRTSLFGLSLLALATTLTLPARAQQFVRPTPVREAPTPPPPQIAPFLVSLDAMTLWRADPSFHPFGAQTSTAPQLTVSLIVWEPARNFSLAPELSVRHEDQTGMLLQAAQATLTNDVVTAGAILRWEPLRWFQPFVRATIGGEHHTTRVGLLTGEGAELLGSIGVGLELDVPLGTGVTRRRAACDAALALIVEGGAVFGSSTVVRVSSPSSPDELPSDTIARTPVRLGAADATAGYFRVALAVRF